MLRDSPLPPKAVLLVLRKRKTPSVGPFSEPGQQASPYCETVVEALPAYLPQKGWGFVLFFSPFS